jgi:hypothetical protein
VSELRLDYINFEHGGGRAPNGTTGPPRPYRWDTRALDFLVG